MNTLLRTWSVGLFDAKSYQIEDIEIAAPSSRSETGFVVVDDQVINNLMVYQPEILKLRLITFPPPPKPPDRDLEHGLPERHRNRKVKLWRIIEMVQRIIAGLTGNAAIL